MHAIYTGYKKEPTFERYLKRGRSDQNRKISSSRGIRYGLNFSSRLFCNLALLKNPGGRVQRQRCDFFMKNFGRGLTIENGYSTRSKLIKLGSIHINSRGIWKCGKSGKLGIGLPNYLRRPRA